MTASTIEHTVKVGDLFIESWGYDQTNIDVYEVVRITAKSVALHKGSSRMQDNRVLPVAGSPTPFGEGDTDCRSRVGTPNANGEILKRVKRGYKGTPWINLTSYSGASLWDGESTFWDTIAAGQPGH